MILELDEARQFFADFYLGEHHLPSKIEPWGEGWCVKHYGEVATTDFNNMTRLVLMAHAKGIRVSVMPHHFKMMRIAIHKRDQESERQALGHPTLERALEIHNKWNESHRYDIIPTKK